MIIAMFALGPMAAYLPRTALAGVVIVIAYGMVDTVEIRRIWQGAAGDAAIMVITLLGTLVISLEFAVLIGILVSWRFTCYAPAPRAFWPSFPTPPSNISTINRPEKAAHSSSSSKF